MTTYFVNGRPQNTAEKALRQHEILEKAGYSSTKYFLISEKGSEYRQADDQVPIAEGEKFEAKPLRDEPIESIIHYEVNGECQITTLTPVALQIILENAGRDAGIDSDDLKHYRLENVTTGDRYNNLDDLIPVQDGDKFVAIHTGATPVA